MSVLHELLKDPEARATIRPCNVFQRIRDAIQEEGLKQPIDLDRARRDWTWSVLAHQVPGHEVIPEMPAYLRNLK